MKIGDLNDRLGNLTKKYTSNKFNIENAEKEAYNATAYSNEANKVSVCSGTVLYREYEFSDSIN